MTLKNNFVDSDVAATVHAAHHNDLATVANAQFNVKTYGATGDGTTNDTTAIQAALTAAASAGGGAVFLPAGTYKVSNLTINSYVALIGEGYASVLSAVSGTSGYMIALTTPATTKHVTIADVQLIPNTGSLGGILLDNTGYGSSSDPLHVLDNVYILSAGGDAFRFDNEARALRISRCVQYNAGGYGFYLGNGAASSGRGATDNIFSDCISGPSTNHGWYIAGWCNSFTGCKSFFSGFNGSTWNTTGCGFEVTNTSSNLFTACSAQTSALHGFDLQSNSYMAVVGCDADTNGVGQATGSAGINTNANTNSSIIGNTGINNPYATNAQQFGIQVNGTQTGLFLLGNTIQGSSGSFGYVGGYGYILIQDNTVDLSGIPLVKLPGTVLTLASAQALSNSSTITPSTTAGVYPLTTTAGVTGIILAAGSYPGQQVTLINKSANTITFAVSGTSNIADGTSDVIPALTSRTYTYDSNTSLWYRAA